MTAVLHDLGGHGDRVVISHATGFHGRAYQPLADLLTDRFDVLALDLPGHGRAPVPAEPELTWMTLAADVGELLAGQPASHLIGHSVGAAVAMVAEARTPGLFRSA